MERKDIKVEVFNIPNILSIFRIMLIPLFVITYIKAGVNAEQFYYISAAILIISGLTDMLDGIIARHFNQITSLGKLLDPFADKLTQLTVVISVAIKLKSIPIAVALMLFVVKEMLMLIGGFIMIRKKITINSAKWYGKVATVVFYVVMAIIAMFKDIPNEISFLLILIAAFFMMFAFLSYILEYKKIIKDIKRVEIQGNL